MWTKETIKQEAKAYSKELLETPSITELIEKAFIDGANYIINNTQKDV
jgi:glutamate formiminotransferase